MGKTKYLSSLIYLAKELCTGSKTLRRNLVEDNSCQILTNGDSCYRESPLHSPTECQSKAKVMQTYLEVTTK
ncbi:hypothetical protein BHE74_00016345 [Ensete ventricosum]|nr:hypothetical protein BHE74_00016345 [Ensete ventricosum]RZR94554.1 hypothetical protein BHM03_00023259 [Ensete ventricosum]